MQPERWKQIETVFHSTLRLNPEERRKYLAQVCEADETLLKEVESLISAFERGESHIDHPVFPLGLQLMTNEPANLAPGVRIGSYEILGFLGRGGMGEVYLARDSVLRRNVALKILPSSLTSDRIRILRFQREARAAAAISHPNVAHIYETGVIDEQHFIAMEFVDGVTLRQRLNNGPITVKESLHTTLEIASALVAAHQQSIVHRDVKPENVMIRNDGLVKILDFGLAKLTEVNPESGFRDNSSSGQLTQTNPGMVMGTVRYMSPEQIRGQEVDARTDVWSLGALLYEMIAGRAPFAAPTPHDEMALILQREPPALYSDGELVSAELRRIVEKALSKELDHRYRQMRELIDDVERLSSQALANANPGIAPVFGTTDLNTSTTGRETGFFASAEHIIDEIRQHKKQTFSVLAIFAFIAGYFFFIKSDTQNGHREVTQPFHEMNINPISNTGMAVLAAVSPDGTKVAQVEEIRGRHSITVRQTQDGETRLIHQADDALLKGLTFSNNGRYLYYVRSEHTNSGSLYRITLYDGQQAKLLSRVDSPISFAPDGVRFAFVRFDKTAGEYSLMIGNVNGTDEKVVATKRGGVEFSIEGPAWSPDGKTILCPVGWWNEGHHMKLVVFDVETGHETVMDGQSWFSIEQVAWLDDQHGVIICAARESITPYQLWRISYPEGQATRITNDMEDYQGVSLSKGSKQLISVQSSRVSQIWVASANDTGHARAIVSKVGISYGVAWTPDRRIVFSTMSGSNLNISVVNADGSGLKQLTMDSGSNYHPAPSRDGRYIVFASNRSGTFNIWRMNAHDGSEPTQLTFGDGSFYPSCSPDNQWVFYDVQSQGTTTLWKVPLAGGEPIRISDEYGRMPIVSPDNKYIASRHYIAADKLGIAISPIQGGPPIKLLPIPIIEWQQVQWTLKGNALTYVNAAEGVSNIWKYDFGDPRPQRLTDFKTDRIYSYAWSPDFRELVCIRGSVISDAVAISDF